MKKLLLLSLFFFGFQTINSQTTTRRDTLQGGLRFERTCFDVLRYNLDIQVDPKSKKIIGNNEIIFKVVENTSKIQLDLFENIQLDSIFGILKK